MRFNTHFGFLLAAIQSGDVVPLKLLRDVAVGYTKVWVGALFNDVHIIRVLVVQDDSKQGHLESLLSPEPRG